jgi:molybdopterin converting factor small subunit
VTVTIHFYSYFKDLAGCAETSETLPAGATVAELLQRLMTRFPKLAGMQKSTLVAVGVDYQDRQHVIEDGDDVSLFPPVQGG